MLQVKTFVFNPYQENTYLIYNESGECLIVDPGMYTVAEEQQFVAYIQQHNLRPISLLNTHCHVDHVLGNNFIFEEYGLKARFHEGEIPVLMEVQNYAPQMGFRYTPAPIDDTFLIAGDIIQIGDDDLLTMFVPGHSPAHLAFYSERFNFLIGGDVLFRNSIGRTDLPGGNHDQLLKSISDKIYALPDNTIVYPGHGGSTTVGDEKQSNPFVRG